MKKKLLFTTIVIGTLTFSAAAQIEKGSLFLGGTIAIASDKIERPNGPTSENKGFVFNPAIGTAIRTNLVLGADIAYGQMKEDYTTVAHRKTHMAGGGIFISKYYPLGRSVYLFGQSRAGYKSSWFKDEESTSFPSQEAHENVVSLNLAPGISYGINNKFFLELGINDLLLVEYSSAETTSNNSSWPQEPNKRKTFGLSTNLANSSSFTIGARFIIPRRKASTGS